VGFRFGRFADGNTAVGCADGVLHTPEEALSVARCMTEFLRANTSLGCWVPQNHAGVWRMIMVRHNRAGDVMVLVQFSSNNCSREALDAELEKLKSFFSDKVKAGAMKLTSLFFQEHNEVGNRANDDSTIRLASGYVPCAQARIHASHGAHSPSLTLDPSLRGGASCDLREATFSENILGLSFRISPSAFFQVWRSRACV
jgi:hypothetical protein